MKPPTALFHVAETKFTGRIGNWDSARLPHFRQIAKRASLAIRSSDPDPVRLSIRVPSFARAASSHAGSDAMLNHPCVVEK
jgi:hypothetical protein